LSLELLSDNFGSQGEHLWNLAHGIDNRRVVPDREAKSISHETTFAVDIDDLEALRTWLSELTEQVARRLRRHNLKGRTVQLKIRYSDFSTYTRSQKLGEPTNSTEELWQTACELLSTKLPVRRLLIRLLGVGVSDLDQGDRTQRHLFDEEDREKQSKLDEVSDLVKDRFGNKALRRGGSMRD
jgi:DNA polymerase-4